VIRDQDHDLKNIKKLVCSSIHIKKNVWIGNKVTITRGVDIGNNSVVGANSVVTKSFDANLLIAGVPAKKIKDLI
jgi:maltose O-acetyltransferase